jgi:hypothetical protein
VFFFRRHVLNYAYGVASFQEPSLETTITIRVRPDGLLIPTKLVNGEEVPLTSRETYYVADELRISARAIQNREELAKVKAGTVFYHREQLAHVTAVTGANGIEFRQCDKQGNILSPATFWFSRWISWCR